MIKQLIQTKKEVVIYLFLVYLSIVAIFATQAKSNLEALAYTLELFIIFTAVSIIVIMINNYLKLKQEVKSNGKVK